MVLRTAGAIVTLLIGLGAQALAQPYPPQQAYPRQPFPSSDELPPLSMPVVQGAPLPPVGVGPADGDRSGTASHSAVSALPLSPESQLGRKITGRQDTTAYGAPFRPAHPLQQKRVQFGRRRYGRGCESDPVKSVREQAGEQAGPPGGGWPGSTTTRVPT